MAYYLANSLLFKSFFLFTGCIAVYAIHLTNIPVFIKIIISMLAILWHYKAFLAGNFIRAFYLTNCNNNNLNKHKSMLLTKNKEQIKAHFLGVSYFNSWLVILCFKARTKIFRILVFRDAVSLEQFKSLQLLAKYNFLPDNHIKK